MRPHALIPDPALVPPVTAPTLRRAAGRTALLVFTLSLLWMLPNLGRPPMLDEESFLEGMELASRDPWNPYRAAVHTVQDDRIDADWARVLPPPLGWSTLLAGARALAGTGDVAALRLLAQLPMLVLACFGLSALTHRFSRRPVLAAMAVATSPPFAAAAASLTADAACLGMGLFGLALFVRGADRNEKTTALVGGLLAGATLWMGFTGLLYWGLVVTYAISHHTPRRTALLGILAASLSPVLWLLQVAVAAADHPFVPNAALRLMDSSWLTMAAINAALLPWALPLLLVAAPALLARGLWNLRKEPWVGLLTTCGMALFLPALEGGARPAQAIFAMMGLVVSGALAGAASGTLPSLLKGWTSPKSQDEQRGAADALFLGLWAVVVTGGTAAVQAFGAYRYLLPALPALAMEVAGRKTGRTQRPTVSYSAALFSLGVGFVLSTAVLAGDHDLATASAEAPARVAKEVSGPVETVWIASGGGMRRALGEAGHPVLEASDLRRLSPGTRLLVPAQMPRPSWLARGVLESCGLPEKEVSLPARLPIRTMNREAGAGFHSTDWGLLPFAWADGPMDRLAVWRIETPCGGPSPDSSPLPP